MDFFSEELEFMHEKIEEYNEQRKAIHNNIMFVQRMNDIEDIIVKSGYTCKREHQDEQLNKLLNYWNVFEEEEKKIQELLGVSLESILYSKYFWCTQYKNRFKELYGIDVGIEQQQYKIFEEMEQRVKELDWSLIRMMEDSNKRI